MEQKNIQTEIYEFKENIKRVQNLLAVIKKKKNTFDAKVFRTLCHNYEKILDEQDKKLDSIKEWMESTDLATARMCLFHFRTELSNVIVERETQKKELELSKRQSVFLGMKNDKVEPPKEYRKNLY